MNRLTLVARSLRFYWRTHLGVSAGCAVSAAVLIGALCVGDSVRGSLERTAHARLGGVESALDMGHRSFRDELAREVGGAAALRVRGMAIREGKQVNRVEAYGVDGNFLKLAGSLVALGPGDLAVNEKLAAALGAKVGDEIALRLSKPSLLSRDAPLASRKERETVRRLFTIRAVLPESFSLKSDLVVPHNAFVDLRGLQEALEMEGRANLLVLPKSRRDFGNTWRLEDAGLAFRASQLSSTRIYLDPGVARKALDLRPDSVGVLSYLVNSIAAENGKRTPYSFVTAGPVPTGMKDDEILVNRWLADHLSIRPGDRVKMVYSELTAGDAFVERDRSFVVRGILEMDALKVEKDLAPEFPGLTDVERCEDWDIGLPMEKRDLKDAANEAYWKAYRQTPKALVTLAAGREMWANRFGDLMSVRWPPGTMSADQLRAALDPAELGLAFRPVREEALRAVAESMDLGQLFLGMSIFLIAASLTLTVLLFVFSVEQRAREMGTLLAVGCTPGRVKRLLLAEGAVVAAVGSLAGIPIGWGFARFLIWGLGTAWSGAVAGAPIAFHAGTGSVMTGAAAALGMSLLAIGLALRRLARKPARQLLAEDFSVSTGGNGRIGIWVAVLSVGGAVAVILGTDRPASAFFAAGAFMLIGGIALVRRILARPPVGRFSVTNLGIRNATRRPGRGMAAAGMLACGCFIVLAVSAMNQPPSLKAGGFNLYGESSVAVHRLTDLEGFTYLPIRMRDGDDASCLNLNQSFAPPLLGIDPAKLAGLGLLEGDYPDGVVPAIVGDSATAVWKLRKKIGDSLDYTDERGKPFKVKLVGALPERLTVFQGRLLISNRDFTRLYPSESGHRVFLVDVPAGDEERVIAQLSRKFENAGLDLVPAVERLKEFYVVESTYLKMFLVLGGMGLLLGSAGMGVLVLRSVMERRGELALLQAVGYTRGQACGVVMAEHRFLLAIGLSIGTVSAAVAVVPAALQPGVHVPYGLLAVFLFGTAALSLAWIWLTAKLALRAPLLPALRNE